MEKFELRRLPAPQRTLAVGFLLTLGIAYAVALLFVFVQTDMKPAGISGQFRGTPDDSGVSREAPDEVSGETSERTSPTDGADGQGEIESSVPGLGREWKDRSAGMTFPKSLKDMILTTHLHMLSISMILFLLGGIFSFSSVPEKGRILVIATGFFSLAATYACMWALRYVGAAFSAGVFVFGTLQALSMGAQFLFSLRDLVFRAGKSAGAPAPATGGL